MSVRLVLQLGLEVDIETIELNSFKLIRQINVVR